MKVTKAVVNKTHEPLRISLPHGKVLHLAPNQTGQISTHSLDHPSVRKLIEAKTIEVYNEPEHDAMLPPGERVEVA